MRSANPAVTIPHFSGLDPITLAAQICTEYHTEQSAWPKSEHRRQRNSGVSAKSNEYALSDERYLVLLSKESPWHGSD